MTLSLTNRLNRINLYGVFGTLSFIGMMILFARTCNKAPDEEPVYTKLARISGGFVTDTIPPKNTIQDSIKRMNTFTEHFNDTATLAQFQVWLYKSVSAESYNDLLGRLSPFFQAYYEAKYKEFLKQKK